MGPAQRPIDRRKFIIGAAAASAAGCSAPGAQALPTVVAFGGGRFPANLFASLPRIARGRRALVAPYAARDPDAAFANNVTWLREIGFREVTQLPLDGDAAPALLAEADLIMFSGGAQARQMRALASVPGMLPALRAAHLAGTVMAGGSAGAAVMTKLMISGGRNGAVYTRAGLGFIEDMVIDQHVAERGREYRLRHVITRNRGLIGIGLDEETGVVVRGRSVTAHGAGTARLIRWENGALSEEPLRKRREIAL